jgi:hypothetical protein
MAMQVSYLAHSAQTLMTYSGRSVLPMSKYLKNFKKVFKYKIWIPLGVILVFGDEVV